MHIEARRREAAAGTRRDRVSTAWAPLLALLAIAIAWPSPSRAAASPYLAVRVLAPADGSVFHTHADIELTADVSGQSAPYAWVEFLVDGVSLGQGESQSPYRLAWRDVAAGSYTIVARARASDYIADSDPVRVVVRDPVIHPALVAGAPALEFTPGIELALPIAAVDELGANVAGAALSWRVETDANAHGKIACTDQDAPVGGVLRTGADGTAQLRFVPGCASANRRVTITAQGSANVLELTLHGPDDRVGAVTLTSGASLLVLPPATATPVSFTVRDVHDAPIGGSTLEFALSPPGTGSVGASARVDDHGHATTQLTLAEANASAMLNACVRGRPGLCLQVPVRDTASAIAAPAAAILGPIAQQALDAPRAQFDNIGGRLHTLRSGARGFSNEANVQTQGGTIATGSGDGKDDGDSPVGVFVAGSVELGKRDSRAGARDGFDVMTRGLTLGVDWRVSPAMVVGAALGGLRTSTQVADGGRQRAHGTSGSLYAQWLPSERAYLNAALNLGQDDFDIRRRACGAELHAQTAADHRALSVEAGYSLARDALRFTPYLRYQYVHAALDALTERGACIDALAIDATSLSSSSFAAGASVDRAFSTRSGVWTPALALEYLGESQRHDAIFARLLAGGPSVPVQLARPDRGYATARFSLSWMTSVRAHPLSAFFGFDVDVGRSDYDSRTFMLGLRIPL